MKIAILGGGFTGLAAAFYLQKRHKVVLFEKEKVLGGLAVGFKQENWNWYLERAIHHLFANDKEIIDLASEVGFNGILFRSPITASLYKVPNPLSLKLRRTSNYRIIPVDTPQDFLKFPLLSLPLKIRAGMVVAFLKLSPFLSIYEKQTAEEFLKKTMGEETWNVLWRELFRKKFGKYAENILASFIWARIKKRTKSLGYITGGFQSFIDHVENKNKSMGVVIEKGKTIDNIRIHNSKFTILNSEFDAVISTLPTPVFTRISDQIMPGYYIRQLGKVKYLHAVSLILETDKPILDKSYWLNIATKTLPLMGLFQHTNFMDPVHYGNRHLCYLSWYVDNNNQLLKMDKDGIIKFALPHLKILNSKFLILNSYLFKAPWTQPIFDKEFIRNKPDFITPVKNLYIANLDMTYPYDRGTNYAVALGKKVSQMI